MFDDPVDPKEPYRPVPKKEYQEPVSPTRSKVKRYAFLFVALLVAAYIATHI